MVIKLIQAFVILFFYSFCSSSILKSEELEYFSSYKNYHFANELSSWVLNKPFKECIATQKAFFEWVYNPKKNRATAVLVSKGDTWAKFRNKNLNNLKSVMVFKKGFKTSQSGKQRFVFDTQKNNSGYIRSFPNSFTNIPKEKDLFKCFKKNEFEEYQNFLNEMKLEYEESVKDNINELVDSFEELEKKSFNVNTVLKDLDMMIKTKNILLEEDKKDNFITQTEIEKLSQQLYSCLVIPENAIVANPNQNIEIFIEMNRDRTIKQSLIVDQNKYSTDKDFKIAADIALNSINSPSCSPLALPLGKYEEWKEIKINFDYSYTNQVNPLNIATFNQIADLSITEIKDLQANLQILNYYDGQIDGLFGKKTSQGVIQWVKENNYDQIYNPEYLNKISDDAEIVITEKKKEEEIQKKKLEEEIKAKEEERKKEEERIALEQKQKERILSIYKDDNETTLTNYIQFIRDFIKSNRQLLIEEQNEFDYLDLLSKLYVWEKYIINSEDLAITDAILEINVILATNQKLNKFINERIELLNDNRIKLVKNNLTQLKSKIDELKIILTEDLESFYSKEIIKTIVNSENVLKNYSNLKEIKESINNIDNLLSKVDTFNQLILNAEAKLEELKIILIDFIDKDEGVLIINEIQNLEKALQEQNPENLNTILEKIKDTTDLIFKKKEEIDDVTREELETKKQESGLQGKIKGEIKIDNENNLKAEKNDLCKQDNGKYFSNLKSLSGKTFDDVCFKVYIEDWIKYLGIGLSTSQKKDLNSKRGELIYLGLGSDKINSKYDADYINGGNLEVYNWYQFWGDHVYEARVVCSMNNEDADQYVENGTKVLKGAQLVGKLGGYSTSYGGGLIINDCHIVGYDGYGFHNN